MRMEQRDAVDMIQYYCNRFSARRANWFGYRPKTSVCGQHKLRMPGEQNQRLVGFIQVGVFGHDLVVSAVLEADKVTRY